MKTRIFALLMALVMVCCAFAGCETDKTDSNSDQDTSSVEETSKGEGTSAREFLVNAVDTQMLPVIKEIKAQNKDYFNVKGTYATTDDYGNEITAEYDYNKKSEGGSSLGEFTLKTGEESFSSKFVSDGNDIFFTSDVLGEKPVMNLVSTSIIQDDFLLSMLLSGSDAEDDEDDGEDFAETLDIYWDYLKEGKLDSLFTKSKGDITIRNYQFKDAEIITFELTDEKAKEAIGADYNKKLDDVDLEIKAEFVIENEKMSAVKASLKADNGEKKAEGNIEYSVNGLDVNLTGTENDKPFFSVKLMHNNVEDNINGKLEITVHTEENNELFGEIAQDIAVTINYKNGKGTIDMKSVTQGEESGDEGVAVSYTTAEMTTTETAFAIDFNYGRGENGEYLFGIDKIKTTIMGIEVTIDAGIKYTIKPIENGMEIVVHSETTMMGMTETKDISLVITGIDAFEVEAPAEFDDIWDVEDDVSISLYQSTPIIAEFLGFVNPDDLWDDIFSDFIVIEDDYNSYSLDLTEQTGSYYSEFSATTLDDGNGMGVLTLTDGRVINVPFGNASWDDNKEYGSVTIDGTEFEMYNMPAGEYNEEFIALSNQNGTVTINYYPQTQNGDIYVDFSFISNGDTYMFSYPNGIVEKTILQDEETGEYYFAE